MRISQTVCRRACLIIYMWMRPLRALCMQHLAGFGQRLLSLFRLQPQRAGSLFDALPLDETVLTLKLTMRVTAGQNGPEYFSCIAYSQKVMCLG